MRPLVAFACGLIAAAGLSAGVAVAAAPPRPASAAPQLVVTAFYTGRLYAKVLDLRTDVVVEPQAYRAGARLQSSGAVAFFKPYNLLLQAHGARVGDLPQPAEYLQVAGRKRRLTRFRGGPGGAADPLSQFVRLVLTGAGRSPCAGPLLFDDGRQRYMLTLSPAGAGALGGDQARLGLTAPATCRVAFRPLAGFKGAGKKSPVVSDTPTATFGWVPAAHVWVLSDLALGTLIGTAHVELTGLTVRGVRPAYTPPAPAAAPVRPQTRRRR